MKWEEIEQFDETNAEHVQALRERCLEGGRVAYHLGQRQGWQLTAPKVAEHALAFALNMLSLERRFPDLAPLYAVSLYGRKWIENMRSWWMEGYYQAQNTEEAEERQGNNQHAGSAATMTRQNERSATHVRDDFAG